MKEEPFGVSPDCRFFYQSEQHREALASLYYAIRQRRGFAVLLGGAGLGKTSVIVQLLQVLKNSAATAYLPHPFYDRLTLLESVLLSFGLEAADSLAQNHRIFFEFLTQQRLAGKTCVVILDEAQDLNYDTLEAIRILSNFETPTEKLVQIVLAGQPRIAETLARPAYEQLRQRINVIARLHPLDVRGIREYIEHRLNTAGVSSRIFAPSALDAIIAASRGIPRNINTLCFNSLSIAFAQSHAKALPEDVSEAIRDLDLSSVPMQQPPARNFRPALIAASLLAAARTHLWTP